MTPKQAARSLVRYGKKHPELQMTAFTIPQVPGSIARSHSVDGVAESLLKSKKYPSPGRVESRSCRGCRRQLSDRGTVKASEEHSDFRGRQ